MPGAIADEIPCPDKLRLIEDDTVPLHSGKQAALGRTGEYKRWLFEGGVTRSLPTNRPRPLP